MITFLDSKGNKYNLKNWHGIQCLDFSIDSPSPRRETEQVSGKDGLITTSITLDGRTGRASFYIEAVDSLDYVLQRNRLFQLFNGKEQFFIVDSREPGKRWLAQTAQSYSPDKLSRRSGRVEINFTSDSPYLESVGRTLDDRTFDKEVWQLGQGLGSEDYQYTHSTSSFEIYNAGDIDIDPRDINLELLITFKGESSNLQIENETTGDVWKYSGSTTSSDIITLDGVQALKNGLSIFADTNYQLINLAPGINNFRVVGSNNFTISFKFRFYYY